MPPLAARCHRLTGGFRKRTGAPGPITGGHRRRAAAGPGVRAAGRLQIRGPASHPGLQETDI